jgi:putative ABC transport system permease protein
MIFGKSVKQLLRTPVTTTLFMVLFAIAAFFICTGAVIWARNQAAIKAYEDVFITIGTVHQRPTSLEIMERWDAFQKDYTRWSEAAYASIIPPSVLDFEGAGYILGPEKRPYYGAWRPDLQLWPEGSNYRIRPTDIVEVTPLEDYVPDHPGEVRIDRMLSENMENALFSLKPGDIILLCDHHNDDPQPLYAGKTYLLCLEPGSTHDPSDLAYGTTEYWPHTVTFSTQYRPDGTLVEDNMTSLTIQEVPNGYYETEEGRRWLEYAGAINNSYKTVPVLPTNGTQLLLPFYNGIAAGEDITPEEYAGGERVCLISENFAKMNGIAVGDTLRLPLYCANYESPPSYGFYEVDPDATATVSFQWFIGPPLNADGKPYPVFSDHEYIVKGIYSNTRSNDAAYDIGGNTVVIPAASVRESDADNIIAYGPMRDATTAFQIPNGSIETFMENYLKQGNDELDFTFYDHGYTQLHRGLENMKRISVLFLAIGSAMSLALVFFFCHVFISKNTMRTAIERMLGYTKKQCAVSLMSGFLLAAAIAVTVGCVAGIVAEGQITNRVTSQEYYDNSFTIGPLGSDAVVLEKNASSALYSPAAGLALLLAAALISAVFMRGNVKEEPLKLLGGRKE